MNLKKAVCGALATAMMLSSTTSALASTGVDIPLDSDAYVDTYLEAINNGEWSEVADFYASDKSDLIKMFLTNPSNQQNHVGLLNVEHAEAVEVVDVEYDDAEYLLTEDYEDMIVKTFVVGTEYAVHEDTEYYADGLCYDIYSVVLEENEWKIREKRTVWDFDGLIEAGYTFDDQYEKTEEVVRSREAGIIKNYNGEEVECVYGNSGGISPYMIDITSYPVPTSSTQITYLDGTSYITEGFHTMCRHITYAECGSDDTFGDYAEARKAIIMAIKTYVWHFYIIQENKDAAYHISRSQIAYKSTYPTGAGFLTDYSAVYDVWMQGSSSAYAPIVFEANFKAGSNADQSAYYHGGDLKQLGCIWLLNHDSSISTYTDLLHYYYDYSNRSQGGPVVFFDSNKNIILK